MTIADEKRELRRALLAARRRLPRDTAANASLAIGERLARALLGPAAGGALSFDASPTDCVLADYLRGRSPCTLLSYMAMPDEPDMRPLHAVLLTHGWRLFVPRIDPQSPGQMSLAPVFADTRFTRNPFGIEEPEPASSPALETNEQPTIDVVLVPGVAFDTRGRRLGMGGGYYDRLLATLPASVKIAPVFQQQLIANVPVEVHDLAVDFLVTEQQTTICRSTTTTQQFKEEPLS